MFVFCLMWDIQKKIVKMLGKWKNFIYISFQEMIFKLPYKVSRFSIVVLQTYWKCWNQDFSVIQQTIYIFHLQEIDE